MGKATVLVGIATHDRADILRKALDSALRQSYAPLRVAVIDDASSDATPALRSAYPAVAWKRWDSPRGYVAARNHLMLGCAEDYYASLDDDSWFIAGDEIALAVDLLDRHPHIAAVAFDIVSPDRPALRPRGERTSVSLFIGCGHVLRLAAVKSLGGYSRFPGNYGGEERDLCLRLIDAGFEIAKLDGVHVWHQKTTTARNAGAQHRSAVCNDLAFTLRRAPFAFLIPALGHKIAAHVLFSIRHHLVRPCICGLGDFFASAADIWRTRKAVRTASLRRYQALARAPQPID